MCMEGSVLLRLNLKQYENEEKVGAKEVDIAKASHGDTPKRQMSFDFTNGQKNSVSSLSSKKSGSRIRDSDIDKFHSIGPEAKTNLIRKA